LGYTEGDSPLPSGIEDSDWFSDQYAVIARRNHPRIRDTLSLDDYLAERHVVVTPWNDTRGVIDYVLDRLALRREVVV
jgi:DNA-binding transcriptional LysR family regulator